MTTKPYEFTKEQVSETLDAYDEMVERRDKLIHELTEALAYWLPDETLIPRGHEDAWNKHIAVLAAAKAIK